MMSCTILTTVLFSTFISFVVGLVQVNAVTFYLFTSENPNNYTNVTKNVTVVDRTSPVIFLIHGWGEHRKIHWYGDLKNAFLSKPTKSSVIQVDWSGPASQFYPTAVYDCPKIGELIADFIINLVQVHAVPIRNIHLVGHSLGGHVAGFAGKHLQTSNLKLSRITSLDPAGPLFGGFWISDEDRLSKHDADVVVAIHTDPWKLGYWASLGSVDIYANGRPIMQPGCPDNAGQTWWFCSHQRSHQFFIDAVENEKTLLATTCWSYSAFWWGWCRGNKQVDLGGEISSADVGDYYLSTNPKKPYGLGVS